MKVAILVILVVVSVQESFQQMRHCNSPLDCHDKECCVSNIQPIGKRNLAINKRSTGHCVPMGTAGSDCLVRFGNATTRPDTVVLACPCTLGLYCKGNHVYEVPLGEHGTCTSIW